MKTLRERFEEKVAKAGPQDCWLWTAGRDGRGYGHIWVETRMVKAPRVALMLEGKIIPPGSMVLHDCDNPGCVNPAHLSIGTQLENMSQAAARGRTSRGERHPISKLSRAQVDEIRRRAAVGETQHLLSREFNISQMHVSNIVCGLSRAHG